MLSFKSAEKTINSIEINYLKITFYFSQFTASNMWCKVNPAKVTEISMQLWYVIKKVTDVYEYGWSHVSFVSCVYLYVVIIFKKYIIYYGNQFNDDTWHAVSSYLILYVFLFFFIIFYIFLCFYYALNKIKIWQKKYLNMIKKWLMWLNMTSYVMFDYDMCGYSVTNSLWLFFLVLITWWTHYVKTWFDHTTTWLKLIVA